jgi:hypothetical protein
MYDMRKIVIEVRKDLKNALLKKMMERKQEEIETHPAGGGCHDRKIQKSKRA